MARSTLLLLGILLPVASSLREQKHGWGLSSKRVTGNDSVGVSESKMSNQNNEEPLFGGRYNTSSDVRDIFQLGYDVAEMERSEDDITEMENIYRNGTSQDTNDPQLTLESMSLTTTQLMLEEPLLTFYMHAFNSKGLQNEEEHGYYKDQEIQFYADTIVSDLFDRQVIGIQAEAVLVLNVWMTAAHELYNVLVGCNSGQNTTKSTIALDRAAALWAGTEDGTSLYKLAESTAANFGPVIDEAWVNTQIVDGFTSIQRNIASGDYCSKDSDAKSFRNDIYRMTDLMVVPLLQNLIHHVFSGENEELAQIYLSAVLPHVLACDPNLSAELDVDSFDSMEEEQKRLWAESLQKSFSCIRMNCDDIGLYEPDPSYPPCQESSGLSFAGYEGSVADAESYSRIDRDLLRLELLLRGEAYGAAFDLYQDGYSAPFSLKELATNDVIHKLPGSLFDLYSRFYGGESYSFVDQEIQRALQREDEFDGLTTDELVKVVTGLLTYETSFLSVMSALEMAEDLCQKTATGSDMTAMGYWDISAALYIGSIEGGSKGGTSEGRLLYGTSKDLCPLFDTCFEGNSRINNLVLEGFSLGKDYISKQECASLSNLIQEFMLPALQTILVQGTLASGAVSAFGDSNSAAAKSGTGHAFARAILPQIHEANNESTIVIESTLLLPYGRDLSIEEFYDAMTSFSAALPDMDVDCQGVGVLQSPPLTLCEPIGQQHPSNLISFGRYIFSDTEAADQIASIALDVRDMMQNVSMDEALQIYEEGRNAFLASHLRKSTQISLASFSRDAAGFMSEDPLFNIYKFALYEDEAFNTDEKSTFSFADDYVQDILATSHDIELATESAVVLNLWMMIAHHLYNAVRACEAKGNAIFHVDAAVALWIGKEQVEGSFSKGWLLYSKAQEAASEFGQEGKEALVNTQLMDAFNALKSTGDTCKNTAGAQLDLRFQVHSILRLLSVPLMQQLFIAIAANDQQKTALYATSVISQCAGCNPQVHSELSRFLIDEFSGENVNEEVIENIAIFLRCMEMSCEDFNYTEDAPSDLRGLVMEVCTAMGDEEQLPPVLTEPTFLSASRIDLDILQIEILMRTKAYGAAFDWYQNGYNVHLHDARRPSRREGSVLTLQQLATLQSEDPVEHLKVFSDYHGSENYVDQRVTEAMHHEGNHGNMSRVQLAVEVSTTLQAMISYQGITWHLQQAVSECKKEQASVAGQLWTTAIALFTGSSGLDSNLNPGSGFAFRSIGGELCQDFGSCTQGGDSISNQALYQALLKGRSYFFLDDKDCTEAEELIESKIIPLLQVALVQGTLKSSVFSSDELANSESFEEIFTSGYVMAQTVLPFVDNVNSESADTIASIFESPLGVIPSHEQTESIFEAFQYALPGMGIDCASFGSLIDQPSLSVCHDFVLPEWVLPHSKFGMDVSEMTNALRNGEIELARLIYVDGKNAFDFETGEKLSLQRLSTDAANSMTNEPIFNLFLHTHGKQLAYADAFVENSFQVSNDISKVLAAESVKVLHVWMEIVHEMNFAVLACQNINPSLEIGKSIDRAAAYWIGDAQLEQDEPENGHLLYGWAQEMGSHFESTGDSALDVNQYMLTLFAKAHHILALQGSCSLGSETSFELHSVLNEMTQQMTIPLVQGLIHALKTEDRNRVRLYAHAFVPLLSSCNEEDYKLFKSELMDASFDVVDMEGVIDRVYQVLPCLGLTCGQIGFHFSDIVDSSFFRPSCLHDPSSGIYPHSSYQPSKYGVFENLARIDQDIRELDILLEMEAYQAAEQVYKYGRHSESSLGVVANTISKQTNKTDPFFDAFSVYFDSDSTYAETLVENTIQQGSLVLGGVETKLSPVERRILAGKFSQTILLPHAALAFMQEALVECGRDQDEATPRRSNNDLAVIAWDRAAALLIGSKSPTGPGHLSLYDLGQSLCLDFGTCSTDDRVAEANQMIADLLYEGRGSLVQNGNETYSSSNCDVLIRARSKIQVLILVPIIQSTISSAFDLSSSRSATTKTSADSFASSRSVVPLIQKLDPDAGSTLEKLLPLSTTSKNSETTGVAVMDAFSRVYEGLNIDCGWIGTTRGYNACNSNNVTVFLDKSSGLSPGALTGIVLAIVTIFLVAVLCWKRKHASRRSSTNLSGRYLNGTTPNKSLDDSSFSESQSYTDGLPDASNSTRTSGTPPRGSELEDFGFDPELIDKSYRRFSSSASLSRKASKILSRIVRYGDDTTNNIPPEDTASSDRFTPPDAADPRKLDKKVTFLVDDDSDII